MKKKLVTERDVQQLAAGSRLEVGRDTLVTPAARDAALTRGVTIVEGGEVTGKCCPSCGSGGACGCSTTPGSSSSLAKLPDGDYLVSVRDGQAHVRKIAP